jgi:hypothetical protein
LWSWLLPPLRFFKRRAGAPHIALVVGMGVSTIAAIYRDIERNKGMPKDRVIPFALVLLKAHLSKVAAYLALLPRHYILTALRTRTYPFTYTYLTLDMHREAAETKDRLFRARGGA